MTTLKAAIFSPSVTAGYPPVAEVSPGIFSSLPTNVLASKPRVNKAVDPLSNFTDSASPGQLGEPRLRYGSNGEITIVNPGGKRTRPGRTPLGSQRPTGVTPQDGLNTVRKTVFPANRGTGFTAARKKSTMRPGATLSTHPSGRAPCSSKAIAR
jgi:hypothetical protein